MEKIGNPPIYSSELTSIMIQKKMEDFPTHPPLNFKNVSAGEKVKLGNLKIKFFPVTHSIPGAFGSSIETPFGNIVITGDVKLKHFDGIPSEKRRESLG